MTPPLGVSRTAQIHMQARLYRISSLLFPTCGSRFIQLARVSGTPAVAIPYSTVEKGEESADSLVISTKAS